MKSRIVYLLLAIVSLAAAVIGARYWQMNYLAGITLVNLPVPKTEIPPYTVLNADMFAQRQFPRALVAEASYAISVDDLSGKISRSVLPANLPVPQAMAVQPDKFRLADPALEVVSIPVTPANSVGGQVQVGDVVNIYLLKQVVSTENADGELPDGTVQVKADDVQSVVSDNLLYKGTTEFIASAPVVATLTDQGVQASTDEDQAMPLRILVVAAPPQVVQDILDAVAMSELGNSLLWVTLSPPQ